jgi:hypothetical protein
MAMLDKDFVNREIGQIVHPTFVLFDSDGNVVWHATGFTDTLEAEIRTVLEK